MLYCKVKLTSMQTCDPQIWRYENLRARAKISVQKCAHELREFERMNVKIMQ